MARAGALIYVLTVGMMAAGPAASAPAPQVTGIAIEGQGAATRVVIDLSRRAEYRVFFLNEPMRAVIDLPPVGWSLPPSPSAPRGLIAAYRYGSFDAETARLVLDLAEPAHVRASRYELMSGGKQRLILELERITPKEFDAQVQPWAQSVTKPVAVVTAASAAAAAASALGLASAPTPPPAPPPGRIVTPSVPGPTAPRVAAVAPPPAPPAARPRNAPPARHTVVIDAGHGGVDPGAIGINGTYEKDVTLAMARELKRQLEASGRYKVVMTRDEDMFVRLRERVAKARAVDGELFISIHADSMRSHDSRGASIYTLSENASDDEAAALAARENRADIIAGVDLSRENKEVASILIDLAQRETMNHSVTFAGHLVAELGKTIQLIPVRPQRVAGFAVLKAADMPSALIELGYLSNKADEQMLTQPAQRAKVAGALMRAIDLYFQKRS